MCSRFSRADQRDESCGEEVGVSGKFPRLQTFPQKTQKEKRKQQHFFTAKINSSCRLGAFCCLSIAFVKKTVELSLVLFVCCCCGDSHDLDLMILQSP